ncbi:Uma2 family endonuclease [Fulvimarina sp. 2208YS6-2-32]|uniref:Uma2 family endonuclease n=1 Tax=Fulvimarina uroteuthidis TaxID=3098149 RepID=A0ABU5I1W9_9HYPH|nr:Uma2 family endonuclease [Fulvimarina sp. 2208YS6-2-32]MDY8109367.1 Uma2 family endonuclease [Fulvimarina sp. 2208YS6-2-32]
MGEVFETTGRMTPDEFFEWQLKQDRNYELVDGLPRLAPKAMTGASRRHDTITVNVLTQLSNRLRGRSCRPHTADMTVVNPNGNVRRPDIVVDCKRDSDTTMQTEEPRVLVEVLSPSTMAFDRFRKVEEYKTNDSIRVVLLVASQTAEVIVWRRGETGWASEIVETLAASIALPEIGCDLTLAEIYEDTGVTDSSLEGSAD